ncbi:MAG: HD domain-containing protein [Chloroflexi bacterium]|nr:MAG: HD domain-containing protein [Chloroflexota bacterium]
MQIDDLVIHLIRQLYAEGDAAHDFDHVLRVTRLGEAIAGAEGADVAVVRAAALLHDVPVPGATRKAHHLAAADFAAEYLTSQGMSVAQVENVVHCIRSHRFRDQSIQPATLEAKCLYDADKLDSIGAIGVARAFSHSGSHHTRLWHQPMDAAPPDDAKPSGAEYTPVHEFVYKLRRLLPTLHTATARAIGQQRHDFMSAFFAQLDAEMMGLQ